MVYVLHQDGTPLMPTENHAKVRILLKAKKAKVVKRTPFTIQLQYETSSHVQKIVLGIDAGSKRIGFSASTETKEVYAGEVILRTDIVDLLSTRRQYRRSRRSRKLRYREARFNNRVHSKQKGWLAPSIEQKIATHIHTVKNIVKMLPIGKVVVETASFDSQKLKADEADLKRPEGEDYQNGDMLGFWNAREFVFWRDNHTCQCCKGKSKDKILNVHHIESRKTGGNAPNNLITLCETCHKKYHKGEVQLKIKRGQTYKDASFMGIMRWTFYNRLKADLSELGIEVQMTYGYLTKNTRIGAGLPKEHYIDALCIANHPQAKRVDEIYVLKKVRCHNRQIHKAKILKGGIRKQNQAPYLVKDYRLFDKVKYKGQECFVTGRRSTGYFMLKTLDGTKVHNSANAKNLILLETRKNYITERKKWDNSIPLHLIEDGVSYLVF